MNIFFLDRNVKKCAQYHCDKHVVKMIIEYAQLLSTAHFVLEGEQVGYKPTHKNHPSAVWVRQSSEHYDWLYHMWIALLIEYENRYGRIHKSDGLVSTLCLSPNNIPMTVPWTDPPQCMPDDCKMDDTVEAYRKYYLTHKLKIAKWKLVTPEWVN